METSTNLRKDTKSIDTGMSLNQYRLEVKRLIDAEVKKVIDEEVKKATQELIDEQRSAIKKIVEEHRLVIREVVEEEKKLIWERAAALRESIVKFGL